MIVPEYQRGLCDFAQSQNAPAVDKNAAPHYSRCVSMISQTRNMMPPTAAQHVMRVPGGGAACTERICQTAADS